MRGSDQSLQARDIRIAFDGLVALDGLDLTLRPNEILGLIGPNGAGKTTLTNVLTGFSAPDRGTVTLDGTNVTRWPVHRIARRGIARTFQNVRLFRRLTVRENLEVAALSLGLSRKLAQQQAHEVLGFMRLEDAADRPCDSLPYGHERIVGIARALALSPRYVLFDEPAAGLNEAEADALVETIAAIPREFGCGVLLIEHNMDVVMGVCAKVQVIAFGKEIALGSPDAIRRDPAVIDAYLGSV